MWPASTVSGAAVGVAISPNGAHVYVVGEGDDGVAVFSRNPGTGALTLRRVRARRRAVRVSHVGDRRERRRHPRVRRRPRPRCGGTLRSQYHDRRAHLRRGREAPRARPRSPSVPTARTSTRARAEINEALRGVPLERRRAAARHHSLAARHRLRPASRWCSSRTRHPATATRSCGSGTRARDPARGFRRSGDHDERPRRVCVRGHLGHTAARLPGAPVRRRDVRRQAVLEGDAPPATSTRTRIAAPTACSAPGSRPVPSPARPRSR